MVAVLSKMTALLRKMAVYLAKLRWQEIFLIIFTRERHIVESHYSW